MKKLVLRGVAYLGGGLIANLGLCAVCSAKEEVAPDPAVLPTPEPPPTASASEIQRAPAYRVETGTLQLRRGEGWQPIAVEGAPRTATYYQGKLYITHGDATVSVYDCTNPEAPTLERRLSTGRGVAADVSVVNDAPWVVTVTQQAVPLAELSAASSTVSPMSPSPTAAPTAERRAPPSTGESRPTVGYSLRVTEPGMLEIATGDNRVRIGDRFVVYRTTAIDNGGGVFSGEEQVAVAEVVAVKEGSALAESSRSALVSDKDIARFARPDQTESNVYPVRVPHVGEFGGTIRPMVNAGSPLGAGVLADLYATYWGNSYFVNLTVQPLGLGWTDEGNVVSTSVLLEGGYDARAFSVGLGVGVSAVNGDMDSMLENSGFARTDALSEGSATVTETDRQETHAAFALSQRVRLGALDGTNLVLRNLLILQNATENNDAGFIYGGTLGKLTIPLDRRNDIFLEGGGGVMGYWLVGAGVGTWITGNGSPGSWKLSISAGAAGIWGTREVTVRGNDYVYVSQQDVEVGGPMVSFGIARRFGI